ncbi:MAG: hypothetical protein DRN47_04455, partial [Candidatus Wolframiiraptor sp.]
SQKALALFFKMAEYLSIHSSPALTPYISNLRGLFKGSSTLMMLEKEGDHATEESKIKGD